MFAFYLVDVAQFSEKAAFADIVHIMKLSLRAGKGCIDDTELDIATLALQKAAEYNNNLHGRVPNVPIGSAAEAKGLESEYYILRTALSWREDRLDVAEYLYNKGIPLDISLGPLYVEKLADILYEVGKGVLAKNDFPMARKWLERAYDTINSCALELLSREALELRTAIVQALITALLSINTDEAYEKARNLVDYTQSEIGDKMVVSLLRLELLQKAPAEVFDSEAYAAALRQIIRTFSPTTSNFKVIHHHIRKLHSKNPAVGCGTLDEFILAIHCIKHEDWTERLVILRIWMTTKEVDSAESINTVQNVFSLIRDPLRAEATAAAQTLIWKRIESAHNRGLIELTEKWCHLALHHVFGNASPLNRAKIERRVLQCAIARNDLDGARSVYYSMTEAAQRETKAVYLMYKVAVRSGDPDLAMSCLEGLGKAPDSLNFIYACCVDSQQAAQKKCAIEALRKLQENYEYTSPNTIHLPAVLRCTIRLLKSLDEEGEEDEKEKIADAICDVFDSVVPAIHREPRDNDGNKLFNLNELNWFARNAYNLGLGHIDTWDLSHIIRILTACTEVISQIPPDIPAQLAADLSLKVIFSNFVTASALVARARAQDKVEFQLQDYLLMRKHVAAFDKGLSAQLCVLEGQARADLLRKLAALLIYDFEGAICLKNWEELGVIVLKAVQCQRVATFQAMGDCLLRSGAPGQVLYATMRSIINEIWALEVFDTAKLAKYMRCLFQATLPLDDDLALVLMGEYSAILEGSGNGHIPMPPEETEWLVTTAFNHAVDCYFAKQDDKCRQWALKAFDLAHWCDDGGVLKETLLKHYHTLNFEVV